MKRDPLWMEKARSYIGTREVPGPDANPHIKRWLSLVHLPHNMAITDETPWCAAFVEGMLQEAGLKGTGFANARSYEHFGIEVAYEHVERGDIAVMWRGDRNGPNGHVTFVEAFGPDFAVCIGGNQGISGLTTGMVGYDRFPLDRILSYRRPVTSH